MSNTGDTRMHFFSETPLRPRPGQGISICPSTAAPTPPAPPALLPRPLPGAGAVMAITGGKPYPRKQVREPPFFSISPCSGPWGYRHRGGADGEGGAAPLPCLYRAKLLQKPPPALKGSNHRTTLWAAVHASSPESPHAHVMSADGGLVTGSVNSRRDCRRRL